MRSNRNKPVSQQVLSLICQLDAIGDYAVRPETDLNCTELSALMMALARAYDAIDARLASVAASPDRGRVA